MKLTLTCGFPYTFSVDGEGAHEAFIHNAARYLHIEIGEIVDLQWTDGLVIEFRDHASAEAARCASGWE